MEEFTNATHYLEKLKNQKVNYDSVLRKMIKEWEIKGLRPKILMHTCCAPCSTYTLEFLAKYADITIFFSNSNIHPKTEYMRRVIEQRKFIEKFNKRTNNQVSFIEDAYDPHTFVKMVQENHLEEAREGGERCTACFNMRLDRVAQIAQEQGFDFFGSSLTISPKKNSQVVNQVGLEVQKVYSVAYLPSDFKKNMGYQRSVELCKEYDVYRQCYCGCVFAAKIQGVDMKEVNRDAREYLKREALKSENSEIPTVKRAEIPFRYIMTDKKNTALSETQVVTSNNHHSKKCDC